MEYERLTVTESNKCEVLKKECSEMCGNCPADNKYYKRLADYEDSGLSPEEVQELAKAKAEGRLVALPCKPGDTIYRPDGLQYSWQIVSITIYPDEIIFTDDSDNIFGLDNIGKTIFFTREEAEKALGGGGDA